MTLTDKELRTVEAVFGELVRMRYDDLNGFLGSVTIEEMQRLYQKLSHREYCERHGLASYEDMDEFDYEQEYREMWEV